MKLTFEQTQGTRTIHFPLKRNAHTPPEITVVIEQADQNNPNFYRVGVAFCAPADQFSKEKGRLLAFGRLQSKKVLLGTAGEVLGNIFARYQNILARRGQIKNPMVHDLVTIFNHNSLLDYFTKKNENRRDQLTLEA